MLQTGGDGLIQSMTVTLTSAQILTLHTTPVQVVPAPGAGKIIVVTGMAFVYKFGTQPYQSTQSDNFAGTYTGSDEDSVIPDVHDLIVGTVSGFDYESGSCQAASDILSGDDAQGIQVGFASNYNYGPIAVSNLAAPGSSYAIGDTGIVSSGVGDATYQVLTVDGGGGVETYEITFAGTNYSVGDLIDMTPGGAQPGVGTGFAITITAVALGDGTLKVTTYYTTIPVP
jgi:hypothetical protein